MGRLSTLFLMVVYQTACFQNMHASSETQVIESFHVKSDVRYRFATTQIESVIRNFAGKAEEVVFSVILPKEAFIVSFSMEIDGKVYNGEVKEKTQAKREYQAAVDKGDSAGLVRHLPRHANIFEVSANVEDESAAKFTLTYQEMLQRKFGAYKHEIHVNPGQAVEDFLIEIFIQENKTLKFVETATLQTESLIANTTKAENKLTTVGRPRLETAYITYRPSVADQDPSGISARFVVKYDVDHSLKGDVMVVDGYFVHFFAPDLSPMPKDIIFVLDVSGSMYGRSIKQLKNAMLVILDDLQPDDRFNIITFSSSVNKWQGKLVSATLEMKSEAKSFISRIYAEGGTDIHTALLTGVSELDDLEDKQRVGMIFFLTDGLATLGTIRPDKIIADVLNRNGNTSAIFGLAFGSDADYDLLTTISAQNSGFARKIYEDSDAALQVASFYEEISAVSMKSVSIEYLPSSVNEYTVTNNKFPVVFNGSEVIVCGRMADNAEVFKMEIKGNQKSGTLDLVLEVDDVNNLILDADESLNKFFTVPRDFSGIVEKMWAYLTIKQYLKEKEIHVSNEAKVEELTNKILQISMKYKFVTPLTSMVVTKPESPEKPVEFGLEDADNLQRKTDVDNSPPHLYSLSRASSHLRSHVNAVPTFRPHVNAAPTIRPLMLHSAVEPPALMQMEPFPFYGHFDKWGGYPHQSETYTDVSYESEAVSTITPAYSRSSRATIVKHASPVSRGFFLSAITAVTKTMSICLAPKNVRPGTYELIRSPKGTKLNIETTCSGKKCKNCFIEKVVLELNGSRVDLTIDENGAWVYQTSLKIIFRMTPNALITYGGEFEVKANQGERPWSSYVLDIKMRSVKGYKGLLGHSLNMSKKRLIKWGKTKMPDACGNKTTDASKYLTNKMASRFKV